MSEEFDFSSGMPSDEMVQYLQMFVDETSEQLDALVEVLLVLESEPASKNELNESFRLIHSIKGAAAMMGLDSITLLTHHLENHFERLRSGLQTLDRSTMELILRCVDFLRDAIEKLREGKPLSSSPELLEALTSREPINEARQQEQSRESTSTTSHAPLPELVESPESVEPAGTVGPPSRSSDGVHHGELPNELDKRLIVYFDRNIELPELKAELIIARVREVSSVLRVSPSIEELSSVIELRTLQLWITTTRSDDELRSVVDVVGVELLEIDVVIAEAEQESIDSIDLGTIEIVREVKSVESVSQVDNQTSLPDSAELAIPHNDPSTSVSIALTQSADVHSKVTETVRVDILRLDKLMNLAGELVVNRARFVQLAQHMTETFKKSGLLGHLRDLCEGLRYNLMADGSSRSDDGSPRTSDKRMELMMSIDGLEEQLKVLERGRRSFLQLNEAIDHFSRVSDGLQRGVLDTRMVPVGPLFNRFKRTVRDIAVELNKKVNFEIRGEKTELDKRMIDELGDPLVHLVRNAIDHGLESESVRRSRGKPEAGTLTLEAVHSGNSVLIYVRDDGGGINVQKVKKRALERGISTEAALEIMTDHEISQFIWAPGFSTADLVSDISGRGVGMDIVKTRIRELNGTIEVDSTLGVGTAFVIRLPLTLAIIRSLLFRLKHGVFAAPIENVREIVSVRSSEIISVHGRNSIEVRGEFIPLIDIDDVFDWHETRYDYERNYHQVCAVDGEHSSVIILSTVNKKIGLLVSELNGCEDLVVKSLDENFIHILGLAGASILGDGSVCLLLDIVSCIDLAHERLRDRKRVNHRYFSTTS